jgi:hypothetical protein
MKYFKEEPVQYNFLHPHFKHLIDLYMDKANNDTSLNSMDISNIDSELKYRFGVLQARNETFGNPVLNLYIEGNILKTSKVNKEDFQIEEIDLSYIPKGMLGLYLVTFLENLVIEIDPFCDYDICQVLCGDGDPIMIVNYDVDDEEVFH